MFKPQYLLAPLLSLIFSGGVLADASADHLELSQSLQRVFVGKGDMAQLKQVSQKPAMREKLLNFAFLDIFTPKVVDQIAAEDQGQAFLQELRAHPLWLRMLLTSGPIAHPDITLSHLAAIWKKDAACATKKSLQTLSVAIALEFGKHKWLLDRAWKRYSFYKDSQKLELLHPMYDHLEAWEKRLFTRYA